MRTTLRFSLVLLVLAFLPCGLLLAADSFATLTAGGDVMLNGKPLPTTGAPNWPLAVGDELQTGADTAVVTFPDGSRITLAPRTKLTLQQCNHCVVQLFSGSIDYQKSDSSRFQVCALGHPVTPVPGSSGSIVIASPDKVIVKVAGTERVVTTGKCPCNLGAPWGLTGMSAGKKAAIVVVVAGAGATAAAVAATRPGPKSSAP